jgi:hypothetical protein
MAVCGSADDCTCGDQHGPCQRWLRTRLPHRSEWWLRGQWLGKRRAGLERMSGRCPSAATLRRWLCLEPIDEGLHAQVSFRSARRKGRRRAAQPISHHAAGAGPASRTRCCRLRQDLDDLSSQRADEACYQNNCRDYADEVDGPWDHGATDEIQVAGTACVAVSVQASCNLPTV